MTAKRFPPSIERGYMRFTSSVTRVSSRRRRALAATALLSATLALQAQAPAPPPPPAEAKDKKSALSSVLAWLGFGGPRTTGALRGGDAPALNLWVIEADNPVRPSGPLKSGMYRSPVFSADGMYVYAIEGAALVTIERARPETSGVVPWPNPDDPPRLLLGHGQEASTAIGVLTASFRVLAIRPKDGTSEVLASSLPPQDVAELTRQLGTCGKSVVYEGTQKGPGLNTRTDIFIRDATARIGRPLTADWPSSVHGQPAFSADCRQIVFVSDEK